MIHTLPDVETNGTVAVLLTKRLESVELNCDRHESWKRLWEQAGA